MPEQPQGEWQQAKQLLEQLRDSSPTEQARALARTTPRTAAVVRELLLADATTSAVLDRDAPRLHADSLQLEQQESLTGEIVAGYRIGELIGEGGSATVFRASRVGAGHPAIAAVKVLKAGWLSEGPVARFRQEHDTSAGLQHPGLPRVLGAGEVRGRPCLLTHFVDGVPIDEHCRRQSSSIGDRLRLFVQVCAAVHHAHKHLIVHRDLKPSNILVDAEGRAHVLDFGIAKLLDTARDPGWTDLHGPGPLTPAFASPEQIRGLPVSTSTDIYSLGVVLYTLLVGASPYQITPGDRAALEHAVVHDRPRTPVQAGAPAVPRDVAMILVRCLEKHSADRYPSVEHLADDIARYLEHRPVRARRATARVAIQKWIRRRPWTAGILAAVLLMLTGGWIGASRNLERVRHSESLAWRAHAHAVQSTNLLTSLLERIGAANLPNAPEFDSLIVETESHLALMHDSPETEARLRIALSQARFASGAHDSATDHARRALELSSSTRGMSWRDTDRCLGLLIDILEGRATEEALDFARQRFTLRTEHLGSHATETRSALDTVRQLSNR